MFILRLAITQVVLLTSGVAVQAEGLKRFLAFQYALLPGSCDVVNVTRDGNRVAELRLGQVYTFENVERAQIGYTCSNAGHGGSSTLCEKTSLAHIIFGYNIEGKGEHKITTLCIE